jgi:hypothetical protein
MIEYSDVYRKSTHSFHGNNPHKRSKPEAINFKLRLLNRKLNISINKDSSLEDLYTSIYNAVYPDFSIEKEIDNIPPAGITHIPMIYKVSILNEKTENTHDIPLHKFITISSYMQANPSCFVTNSRFGKPVYTIYVLDEYALENLDKHLNKKRPSILETMFSCYYSRNSAQTSNPH